MTLNDWMTETDTTDAELAVFLGCDRSWVSKLRREGANPSLRIMDLTAIFTDGRVTRADWPAVVTAEDLPAKPAQPAGH